MAPRLNVLTVVTVATFAASNAFSVFDPSSSLSVRRQLEGTVRNHIPLSSTASAYPEYFEDHDESVNSQYDEYKQRRRNEAEELHRRPTEATEERIEDHNEQLPPSPSNNKFITGDALQRLRQDIVALRAQLQEARKQPLPDTTRIQELERRIVEFQKMDAEFIYSVSLENMEDAQREGRFEEAKQHHEQAMEARNALPVFNLSGLWVGKFSSGYELINVTYAGDTLIAHKVTGSKNVPKGQASFEVDLSPFSAARRGEEAKPIELGEDAARQWGCRYLQRYGGRGQVAGDNFQDSQWVKGQLILVSDYFSFAWLPIGHQVFFGRPTPELVLKLHKKEEKEQEIDPRKFLQRCWEETQHVEDDIEFSAMDQEESHHQYYDQVGCFE